MNRRAMVTLADRDWAMAQKPAWARMYFADPDEGEIVDRDDWLDGDQKPSRRDPAWFDFVIGEVESFERYFDDATKTAAEWSAIWRKSWWPKRREDWVFMSQKNKNPHPFFRRGSPEFARALKVATAGERAIWKRFGVAQFTPDDPRLSRVVEEPAKLTDRSQAMSGGK